MVLRATAGTSQTLNLVLREAQGMSDPDSGYSALRRPATNGAFGHAKYLSNLCGVEKCFEMSFHALPRR